jgi:hypothetical protein
MKFTTILFLLLIITIIGYCISSSTTTQVEQFYSFVTVPLHNDKDETMPRIVQIFSNRVLGFNPDSELVIERKAFQTFDSTTLPSSNRIPNCSPLIASDWSSTTVHEHYEIMDDKSTVTLKKVVRFDAERQHEVPQVTDYHVVDKDKKYNGRVLLKNDMNSEIQKITMATTKEFWKTYGKGLGQIVRKITENVQMQSQWIVTVTSVNATRSYNWYNDASMGDTDVRSGLIQVEVARNYCSDKSSRIIETWYEYYYMSDNMPLLIETYYPHGLGTIQQVTMDQTCIEPVTKRAIAPTSSASNFTLQIYTLLIATGFLLIILL